MKWLADENLDNDILRGALRRNPWLDIVRAQDVPEIYQQGDVALLSWATHQGRAVLTHDLSTMPPAIQQQLDRASRCVPVVLVPDSLPIGSAIEQILLLDACSVESDWTPGLIYLPLK